MRWIMSKCCSMSLLVCAVQTYHFGTFRCVSSSKAESSANAFLWVSVERRLVGEVVSCEVVISSQTGAAASKDTWASMSTSSGPARTRDRSSAAPSASESFPMHFHKKHKSRAETRCSCPKMNFHCPIAHPFRGITCTENQILVYQSRQISRNKNTSPVQYPSNACPSSTSFLLRNDTQGEYIPDTRNQTNANSIRMNAGGNNVERRLSFRAQMQHIATTPPKPAAKKQQRCATPIPVPQ